ncbi:MAG: T9SS type A sorting domain-containing protein [Saprospiraceae bacterium]
MKLRIIIPFLFLLCAGMMRSENYVVTVYGTLVDGKGNGVPNRTIYLNNTKTSKFKVGEKTSTLGNGEFKLPLNIPDSIGEGALLLSYVNCNDKEIIQEVHFSKQNNIIQVKLIFCEKELSTSCSSTIKVKRVNDTLSRAVVTNTGVAPFKHKWSNGQDGDSITFKTKSDDKICVVSLDAGGCNSTACINDPSTQKCNVEIIIKRLTDSNSIAIAIATGTAPFKYKWTNGSENDTVRYLPGSIASGYCVLVNDSTGCVSSACIASPTKCISEVIAKRINDTLALAYVITKGNGPFTNTWTTGQIGDSIYFNPLNKIKICVRSVDTTGCVAEACVNSISEPCRGYIERSGNVLYAYLKNGTAKTYKWSNGSDDAKIEIKEKGEYCVVIHGVEGCESRVCFTVTELDTTQCTAEITATKIPVGNADKVEGYRLSINAKFPLKYISWSTGETAPQIIVRKTGEYCVSISDNVRCKLYICKKVEVDPIICTLKITVDSIPASSNSVPKKFKLTAVSSYDAKILVWSTNETTKSIMVEKSGKYCVTVSNDIGCKLQECVTIELPTTPPPPPPIDCSTSLVIHPISASEVKLVPRVSGTVPFTFLWTTGSKDATINVKTSGNYCVTIKDGRGCISKACAEIAFEEIGSGVLGPIGDEKNKTLNPGNNKANIELNVFPNPSQDKVNYIVKTKQNQDGILNVSNIYGKLVYQEKIKFQNGESRGDLDLSFLGAGVYQVTIDQGGYITTSKIVIAK